MQRSGKDSVKTFILLIGLLAWLPNVTVGQTDSPRSKLLENALAKESPADLATEAQKLGNANRGAFLFYQPLLGCAKCHSTGDGPSPLGSDLTKIDAKFTGVHIVESLLQPSKEIKNGFDTVAAVTSKGLSITGLLVREKGKQITLRNTDGKEVTLNKDDLSVVGKSKTSLMPAGLVNQMHDRQQFLDLVRFVMEVASGGPLRASELRPPPSFFALPPLPEYEKKIDHAGMIAGLNAKSFERGKAIYLRVCANCHGTKDKPGSLPTSLRFADGKFKAGSDPYSMYRTLTHGYGMMIAQRWLVPMQKYDVIHYIREAYLKTNNPTQYTAIDGAYLAKLPKGDTFGPKPSNVQPWVAMNNGPKLTATNGVCVNPDGTFFVTDQEGHWDPKNRINWVKKGGFYGNMFGYHDVTDSSDEAMKKPLCWITNRFDRSSAELMWVTSKKWGPLHGSLLNFSYGNGKIFIVPHEKINGEMQGGMCPLPLPIFPTGVMRGRFHPTNGQLYACGMFAWAGNQQQPGGFYRIRYTGKPVYLPLGLQAKKDSIAITFTDPLGHEFIKSGAEISVKVWDLKRSARYGSKHFNERTLKVAGLALSDAGKTLLLEIPGLQPTRGMEIRYSLRGRNGETVQNVIHNTIHRLGE